VSHAYYALFHAITLAASEHLLPNGADAERLRLTRTFEHRSIKDVCNWINGHKDGPNHATALIRSLWNTPIDDLAGAFLSLQERRHEADYDHSATFERASVLVTVQDAEQAVRVLREANDRDREAFLTLVALKSGLR
jgi:hypothetical protein